MKASVTLLVLVIASCATGYDPETSASEQTATAQRLIPVNTSCQWIPGKSCYGVSNDGDSIWPTEMGITSVQVLTRSGPDRLEHTQHTFLAFVIWNKTTVGRIFRVDIGPDSAHWRATLGDIAETRTLGNIDFDIGSTGGAGGGPVGPPHPNVMGPITFDTAYLAAVKRYAGVIDDATNQFLITRAVGID